MEEERECRVCRGEAESERPLYEPCMCSGSISYVHQDCLLQWLQHSGKDSCELCKYRFNFKPVYAEDAPATVPTTQVISRCARKAAFEWLPFLARLILAAFLWLGFVPCTTSWIYRIWIHRASVFVPDLIRRRLHGGGAALLWNDSVSGLIIATFIIFSFLSLMSFADFLRFHWDVREGNEMAEEQEQGADNGRRRGEEVGERARGEGGQAEEEGEAQHGVQEAPEEPALDAPDNALMEDEEDDEIMAEFLGEEQDDDDDENGALRIDEHDANLDEEEVQAPGGQEQEVVGDNQAINNPEAPNNDHQRQQQGGRWPNVHHHRPGEVDGDADMELHVAVDELMGIRGPFPFLLRNILWLTAFNGAYLGLFAFIPYSVGSAVVGAAEKYVDSPLLWLLRLLLPASICTLAGQVSQAAAEEDHTLQLPDLGIILLGYLMMSAMVFTWRSIVCAVCQRAALPMLGKVVRVLECTAAVVKVGLLLFLKMLFLPLMLGLWLDAATCGILGPTSAERVRFATENLVGALLLHWVAGITFMLFVTVSVLQLREVLHPDLLAKIIRPQEPQPDLLGSLLQESGMTHARRMAISLLIYVVLLFMFVWIPATIVENVMAGKEHIASQVFEFRTFYLAPQLQIPLELILFHLAMLAFLEHCKSGIGRLQHWWLTPFCKLLGLTRCLLPVARLEPSTAAAIPQETDAHGEVYVAGAPMLRPPIAWEEVGGPEQGRWAWGNEQMSEVERNVAPRHPLDHSCLLSMTILLLSSWIVILVIVISGLMFPLILGRGVFALLHVPSKFYHDPFAFAIGVGICWIVRSWVLRLQANVTMDDIKRWANRAVTPSLQGSAVLLLFQFLWSVLCPLLVGLLFELTLVVPSKLWGTEGLSCLNLKQDLALGLLILHVWAYLSYIGFVDGLWLAARRGPQPPVQADAAHAFQARGNRYQTAIQDTLQALRGVVIDWNWDMATFEGLVRPLVWPLAMQFMEILFLPTNVALLFSHAREKCPSLLSFAIPPQESISTAELQISCFRMTVLAWVMAIISMKCAGPISKWMQSVKTAVRDEHYLLGVQLQNFHHVR